MQRVVVVVVSSLDHGVVLYQKLQDIHIATCRRSMQRRAVVLVFVLEEPFQAIGPSFACKCTKLLHGLEPALIGQSKQRLPSLVQATVPAGPAAF
jgi:hypothetical protein